MLIGSASRKGFKLKKILKKLIRTKDYDIEFEEINKNVSQKKTPVLIIDNEVVDTSKVNNSKKMFSLLTNYVKSY